MDKADIQLRITELQAELKHLRKMLKDVDKPKDLLVSDGIAPTTPSAKEESRTSIDPHLVRLFDEFSATMQESSGKDSIFEFVKHVSPAVEPPQNVFALGNFYRNYIRPALLKRYKRVAFVSKTKMLYWTN